MKSFQPTPEFVPTKTAAQSAQRKEVLSLAVAFYRMSQTEDGKRVLAHLGQFVNHAVPMEHLPHGAVLKEGQFRLIHEIHTQIAQGEKCLAGTT